MEFIPQSSPREASYQDYLEEAFDESEAFADSLDMVENPPHPSFLEQARQEPALARVGGVDFAVRKFRHNWQPADQLTSAERPAPVLFFTQWGVGISSDRGIRDVYGLVQHLEAGREVITIDTPGVDQAGPSKISWRTGLNYLKLGEQIEEVLNIAGFYETPFHVAGVSHGGDVAVGVAAALGNRAKSVTVISTPGEDTQSLLKFGKGFVIAEGKGLKQAIASAEPSTLEVVKELEASRLNDQFGRLQAMLALWKFARLMRKRPLADGVEKLNNETALSVFCGTKEAILSWRKQLELVRTRNDGIIHRANITLIGGGSGEEFSVDGTHARLAFNRYEPGAQVAMTVRRLEKPAS